MSTCETKALVARYVGLYKRRQRLLLVQTVFQILTNLGMAIAFKVIMDNALMQKSLIFLIFGCSCYFLCAVGNVFLAVSKQKNASIIGEGAISQLREDVIDHYLKLPTLDQLKIKSGDLLTFCMQDVAALKEIICSQYVRKITNATTVIVLLIGMLFLEWRFTLVVLTGMPLFLLAVFVFGERVQNAEKAVCQSRDALNQFALQTIAGAEVIKHLDARKVMERKFVAKLEHLKLAVLSKRIVESLKNVSVNFLSVAFVGVFMIFGGYLLIAHKISSLGALLSFMTLIPVLYYAMADAIKLRLEEKRSAVNLERINGILEMPVEQCGILEATTDNVEIMLEHVGFCYGDRKILYDINLRIVPGEKIAIVGQSGSGKTTLAYLLAGILTPQTGKVLYGGKSLAEYTPEARGKMVAMMEQEAFFFADSVKNIICGGEVYNDELFHKIAKEVGLDSDIAALSAGYATSMSEKTEFSGGKNSGWL